MNKTPEQIAEEAARTVLRDCGLPETWDTALTTLGFEMGEGVEYGDALKRFAAAAIKADRAQWVTLLEREASILDSYRRDVPPSNANEALVHNMSRASEAMRLAAGWDASRAFQESF